MEVDEVAEAYLRAPERSAERAELLRRYRELTGGSSMWVKTPIKGGTA